MSASKLTASVLSATNVLSRAGIVVAPAVEYEAEVDRLVVALASVLPASRFDDALAEVDRRAGVFGAVRESSPSSGPHPRLAALQSVLDDALRGWLS